MFSSLQNQLLPVSLDFIFSMCFYLQIKLGSGSIDAEGTIDEWHKCELKKRTEGLDMVLNGEKKNDESSRMACPKSDRKNLCTSWCDSLLGMGRYVAINVVERQALSHFMVLGYRFIKHSVGSNYSSRNTGFVIFWVLKAMLVELFFYRS